MVNLDDERLVELILCGMNLVDEKRREEERISREVKDKR